MLKRIGLSAVALFAALAFVQPQTASAQNRDYNDRNSYNVHQANSYGQSAGQWNAYGYSDRSQNSYGYNRQPNGYVNGREQPTPGSQQFYGRTDRSQRFNGYGWRENGWRDHERDSHRDRRSEDWDGYNSYRR